MHLFTIGIASYNYSEYILKALNAIKRQSFKDYEILISDDCSTDCSIDVIEGFIKANPEINIRLIKSNKNEGLVANKNKLIDNAQGQYLMICDADDWMADNCLEKMADVIKKENPDRIISEIAHIDSNGKIIQIEKIPKKQTKWGWNIHHGSVARVDILKKYNIRIDKEPDDVYYTVRLAEHIQKMSIINEVLYYWLVHTDSEGRKNVKNMTDAYVETMFVDVLRFVTDMINKNVRINLLVDAEELKLVRLKLYYFYIIFVFQRQPLKIKLRYYNFLHEKIGEMDSKYKKTACLSEKVLRDYPMKAIRICILLENMHLMKFGLIGFHLIAKIKYFDQ